MLSPQIKTICRVLGNALLSLANMTEEEATRLEMNGKEYIDHLDRPDVGGDTPIVRTNTAAQVFGSAAEVIQAAGESHEGLNVDTTAPVKLGLLNDPEPQYIMTEAAGEFTREQYHESSWTDEALIEAGFMKVVMVDNSPNVQPAGASTSPPAPSAPAPASIPAAAPAAPANTAAAAPAGAATVDSSGLPWDTRIHSGGRTTKADGTWTKKKGVGDVYYNQVVAELRQGGPAPAAAPFISLTAAAMAAPAPKAGPTTFADLCKWITSRGKTMNDGLVHAEALGLKSMGMLAQPGNASLIPLVYEAMKAAA